MSNIIKAWMDLPSKELIYATIFFILGSVKTGIPYLSEVFILFGFICVIIEIQNTASKIKKIGSIITKVIIRIINFFSKIKKKNKHIN